MNVFHAKDNTRRQSGFTSAMNNRPGRLIFIGRTVLYVSCQSPGGDQDDTILLEFDDRKNRARETLQTLVTSRDWLVSFRRVERID